MHHIHGPPQLGGGHINKTRGPVSCTTDMAIVNHMKGTSIHPRHRSLSQTRQKFNSHICQLLWHSWEITTTCAHEAVRQLKDTSACVKTKKNKYMAQGKSGKSNVWVHMFQSLMNYEWLWTLDCLTHANKDADTLTLFRQQHVTPQAWR